jgi:hypothetical protein
MRPQASAPEPSTKKAEGGTIPNHHRIAAFLRRNFTQKFNPEILCQKEGGENQNNSQTKTASNSWP